MIKYNLSNIPGVPVDANITDISFSVYYLEGDIGVDGDLCSLFVISKNWIASEVTWKNAIKTDAWEQLDLDTKHYDDIIGDTVQFPGGGDRIFPCAASSILGNETNRWETYNVTSAIKGYIKNPGSFFGMYLKPYLGNTGRYYASSEWTEQDKRPKLTIKFSGTGIISNQQSINSLNDFSVVNTAEHIRIKVLASEKYSCTFFDLKGSVLYSFTGKAGEWYRVHKSQLTKGVNVVRIAGKDSGIISTKNVFLF